MQRVVILSRGHGYGHAAKDAQLAQAIGVIRPDVQLIIASSGSGLEYYRSRSVQCVDLGIPDDNDQDARASIKVLSALMRIQTPDLVIADEVFSSPMICSMLGLRNILLTHWFYTEIGFPAADRRLRGAEEMIILDFPDAHCVPLDLGVPVHFTGPLVREFSIDRAEARAGLGISSHTMVVVATFGAITRQKLPEIMAMLHIVLVSWQVQSNPTARLFLLAPRELGLTLSSSYKFESVTWVGVSDQADLFYRAADLVLANATFTTLSTLARNRVPTVTFIGTSNPVDRIHAKYFESIGLVQTVELSDDPNEIWVRAAVAQEQQVGGVDVHASLHWGDPMTVAARILSHL